MESKSENSDVKQKEIENEEAAVTNEPPVDPVTTNGVKLTTNGVKLESEKEATAEDSHDTAAPEGTEDHDKKEDTRPPKDPLELEKHLDSKVCPACDETYTAPKMLYCLHSACGACIQKQVDKYPTVPKPKITCYLRSCNEGLRVARDIYHALSDNTYLDTNVNDEPAEMTRCTICNEKALKVLATHKCSDCSAKLCGECSPTHTEGHNVKTYEELIEKDKTSLEAEMIELQALGELIDVTEEVEERFKLLNDQEAKDLVKIEQEAEKMIEQIQSQKDKAVEALKDAYKRQRNKCTARKSNCDHIKKSIKSTCQVVRRVIGSGTATDYFFMKRAFEERIKSLSKRKPRPNINMTLPKVEALDSEHLFKESPFFKVHAPVPVDAEESVQSGGRRKRNYSGEGQSDGGQVSDSKKIKFRKVRQQQPYQRPLIGQPITSPGPVVLRPVQRIDAALPTDTMIPDLLGIAYTPDGGLAVVDRVNNCIKLFNPGGDFEESFSAFRPESIAIFGNIIAWSNQQSLFFNAKGRGCIYKMDFETGGGRYPLTPYMDKYCLVANVFSRYLHMLSPDGMRIQQIDQRGMDGKVMGHIVYIAATRKGTYVMSDPESKKITYTNNTGRPFAQFPPQNEAIKKFEPSGICCDKRGNVFVADHKGNRLFLLSSNGKEMQNWPLYGLVRRPTAMVCTPERQDGGYLFITGNDGFIDVLEYQYK